jgi:hypothetical protein
MLVEGGYRVSDLGAPLERSRAVIAHEGQARTAQNQIILPGWGVAKVQERPASAYNRKYLLRSVFPLK